MQIQPQNPPKQEIQRDSHIQGFTPEVKLFLGVPGSGKTYLIKKVVSELIDKYSTIERNNKKQITAYCGPSLLVLSPTREWETMPDGLNNLPVYHYIQGETSKEEFESYPFWRVDDVDTLFRIAEPETIIVLEELLCISEKYHGLIQEKIALHRHLALVILLSTQRPRCIPRAGLAMASRIYLFKISDTDDTKTIKGYLTPKQLQFVPHLKRGQFITLQPGIQD